MTKFKLSLLFLTACGVPYLSAASGTSADGKIATAAVDAKGVRHTESEYRGHPPWINDYIEASVLRYPESERTLYHQGRTVLDLTLDLKTGRVANVRVMKSSGYPVLDDCAIKGMAQRRWPPGKWKEIVMPVTFTIPFARPPLPFAPFGSSEDRQTGAVQPSYHGITR